MLGGAVMARLGAAHDLSGVDMPDGDLADAGVAEQLLAGHRPDWVLHTAAWTDVDGAETQFEAAMAGNGLATERLAKACDAAGCGLTYLSTDYVFDGEGRGGRGYDEDETRAPVNAYGATKARGEEAVAAMRSPWQIVRTSWLFGDGRVNFVKTVRRLLSERDTIQVVDDQRGCPTYADDLADVLGFLVSGRIGGIFHGTNQGACSWFELAREVAAVSGADPARVTPCDSAAFPRPARRPACSVLLSRRLEEAGCPPRPDWRDAVARYCGRLDAGDVRHP